MPPANIGEVKIKPGLLVNTPVAIGTGILDLLQRLAKQGIMRFFAVQEKIDHFPDMPVRDLAVQVFVNYLGPLLCGDVGQQIGGEVPGDVYISRRPGKAGAVGKVRSQSVKT